MFSLSVKLYILTVLTTDIDTMNEESCGRVQFHSNVIHLVVKIAVTVLDGQEFGPMNCHVYTSWPIPRCWLFRVVPYYHECACFIEPRSACEILWLDTKEAQSNSATSTSCFLAFFIQLKQLGCCVQHACQACLAEHNEARVRLSPAELAFLEPALLFPHIPGFPSCQTSHSRLSKHMPVKVANSHK